jgi:predicted DNA-binding transcriptional regulator AlpA
VSATDGSVTINAEPLEISIDEAARMVGLSRAQFYRDYLDTGRVRTVPKGKGGRRRAIVTQELKRAHEQYVAERRAGQ